jgi:DNA recombination protein RmuC
MQPDVIVRLPGGRLIVIDSKVALNGYLDAVDCTDEAQREICLDQHAAQMRAHMKNLASKSYWSEAPDAVDFVAMFVPGEHFFTAAIERDRSLFDDAMRNRVLIVTPATLMALAKAVAFGWRQEDASKNAQEVAELGRILFARLSDLADRTLDVGRSIGKSVEAYNSLVGTLETRVLPQARRFEQLGAGDPGKAPKALEDLQAAPRALSLERFEASGDAAGRAGPPANGKPALGKGAAA